MPTTRSVSIAIAFVALALGCGAPSDDADEGAEQELAAARPSVTFFTYNICGADPKCSVADPTAAVIENILAHRPTAFALQEVCQGQADAISRALRARGLPYVQRFQNAASKLWNLGCGGPQGWGNAVFHLGSALGAVEEGSFETQASFWSRAQNRGYVCVLVPEPRFWACSTHIDVAQSTQQSQIAELDTKVQELATSDGTGTRLPVLVGGDFNLQPGSDRIDAIFAPTYARGRGHLHDSDVAPDRTFAPGAATHGPRKIDYVFATEQVEVVSSTVIDATSDHRLLVRRVKL